MAAITNIFTILLIISSSFVPLINSHQFSKQLSKKDLGLRCHKTSHLQFYFYDKFSNPNATAVPIAAAPTTNTSPSFFGSLVMIDDALLKHKDKNSDVIGRAQGMYAGADQTTIGLLMVVNYVFTDGSKYNGSSLSVLARNAGTQQVREMPIVGGTGAFRFAHGFAEARTGWINFTSGDAIVGYNVTVYHYGC